MKKTMWTEETARAEALKYNHRADFKKNGKGAYNYLRYAKLMSDSCKHMTKKRKWTVETAKAEALKYSTKRDFFKHSKSAHDCLRYNGLIDEACSHMERARWGMAEEEIYEEAIKYQDRSEFRRKSKSAYYAAYNKGILYDVCSHMSAVTTGFNKDKPAVLYYLSINDGMAYKIGITNKSVTDRYSSKELSFIKVLKIAQYNNGFNAYAEKQEILKKFADAKYTGDPLLSKGNTELFCCDVLDLDIAS